MRRAKTHLARAEFRFTGCSDSLRRGKGKAKSVFLPRPVQAGRGLGRGDLSFKISGFLSSFGRGEGDRFAEALAQQRHDLPDLHDLFGRGQNERRQAFPRVLAQHAQSAARGDGARIGASSGKVLRIVSKSISVWRKSRSQFQFSPAGRFRRKFHRRFA